MRQSAKIFHKMHSKALENVQPIRKFKHAKLMKSSDNRDTKKETWKLLQTFVPTFYVIWEPFTNKTKRSLGTWNQMGYKYMIHEYGVDFFDSKALLHE